MTEKNRTPITSFGQKRKRGYVTVYAQVHDGRAYIRVEWKEGEQIRKQSFEHSRPGKAEAKAFALGTHERLVGGGEQPTAALTAYTLRQLRDLYLAAEADAWRSATLVNFTGRWRRFELFAGRDTLATDVTRELLDRYKQTLLSLKTKHDRARSPRQVKHAIAAVTAVFRWAVDRDLIAPTKVGAYRTKLAKDAKGATMAEFSSDERAKVLAALDPRDSRQWRAWALTVLLGYCGPRQTAARLLTWDDLTLDAGRESILWRPENAKTATTYEQPMPAPVIEAFWVAYGWALAWGYTGRFVFFRAGAGTKDRSNGGYVTARSLRRAAAKPDKPIGYAAYMRALHEAEKRAGIEPVLFRGAHGFRRGVAGDIHAATGSEKAAADWIGDRSVKIVRDHYLMRRNEELRKTALLVVSAAAPKTDALGGNGGFIIDRNRPETAEPSENLSQPLQSSLK